MSTFFRKSESRRKKSPENERFRQGLKISEAALTKKAVFISENSFT